MSNLEKQLKFLKASFPQATAPKVKSGKESFLFSAEKAGTLSVEEIYVIGVNGTQQLCELDSRFSSFLNTLFHKKSTSRNRELQTKQENEELDADIDKFLLYASPYFLLKPTHMALEYLIRRYKMIQILNISESMWHFLESVQKTGSSVSRDFLINRCLTDFNVLEFVCEMTQKCCLTHHVEHKTLVSFYAAMVIQYIDTASDSQLKDVFLKRLFSYIISGVKASRDMDYQSASFMILTQIASKKALAAVTVDTFIKDIALSMNKYHPDHALLTIIFLCQSQKVAKLNADAFSQLVKMNTTFTSKVQEFMKTYNLQNFLDAFVSSLVEQSFHKKDFAILEKYTSEVNVEKQVPSIIYKLFKLYCQDQSLESFVQQILLTLERGYSRQVDEGISLSLNGLDSSEQELVLQFTKLTFRGTQHEIVEHVNTSLFLCLEHQDAKVRMLALKKLQEILSNKDRPISEQTKQFIASSLMLKLNDDEEAVLDMVLSFPNLLQVVDASQFIPSLAKKYLSIPGSKQLKNKILSVLLQDAIVNNKQLFDFILPVALSHLLRDDDSYKRVLPALCKSQHPLVKGMNSGRVSSLVADHAALNSFIIAHIAQNVASDLDNLLPICVAMYKEGKACKFLLFTINHTLRMSGLNETQKMKIVDTIISLLDSTVESKERSFDMSLFDNSFSKSLDIRMGQLVYYSYFNMIQNLPGKSIDFSLLPAFVAWKEGRLAETTTAAMNHTFMIVHIFCRIASSEHFSQYAKHLELLMSRFLAKNTLWFLSLFWSARSNIFDELIQRRALQVAAVCLGGDLSSDYQLLIPSLLANLGMHNSQLTRQYALACLELLITASGKVQSNPLLQINAKDYRKSTALNKFLEDIQTNKRHIVVNHRALLDLFQQRYDGVVEFIADTSIASRLTYPKSLLFSLIDKVKSTGLVTMLSDYLFSLTSNLIPSVEVEPDVYLQLQCLANIFKINSSEVFSSTKGFNTLIQVLNKNDRLFISGGDGADSFIPALLLTGTITATNYDILDESKRSILLKSIASVLLNTSQPDVTFALQQACKDLPIAAKHIIALIPDVKALVPSHDESMDLGEDHAGTVDELVNILEMIQLMEKIPDKENLIGPLFDILSVFENDNLYIELEKVDFATNMIFSVLRTIAEHFGQMNEGDKKQQTQKKIQSKFNIDMVIRSLQRSRSSRIKSHAILLIGELSRLFPVDILGHIVSVIQTMEYSMKQSDSMTFQVIQKTVLQIVPEVLQKGTSMDEVVSVFVKCFDYIPTEKRMEFYTGLVKAVSRKRLYVFVLLFLAKALSRESEEIVTFVHSFLEFFQIPKQLACLLNLAKIALSIVDEQSGRELVFDMSPYSKDQKDSILDEIVTFISTHFSSVDFLKSLIAHDQEDSSQRLCQKFLTSLNEFLILTWCHLANRRVGEIGSVCTKVQQLLNGESFINLVKVLLKNKERSVREKALEIFNSLLSDPTPQTNKLLSSSKDMFMSMLPTLSKLLKSTSEEALSKQGAVIAIELLTRRFAKDYADTLTNCVPVILKQLEDNVNTQISSSCALCLSTMIAELGMNVLQYLPTVVDGLLRLLQSTFPTSERTKATANRSVQLLQLSALSAIKLLMMRQLNFMSPYFKNLIVSFLHPVLLQSQTKKVQQTTSEIIAYLAETAQVRHILKPILESYESCIMLGDKAVIRLFGMLETILASSEIKTTDALSSEVNSFLLKIFDHRRLHDADNIDAVEDAMCSLYKTWIMKLNENMFRPMLLDLIEWGRESLVGKGGSSMNKAAAGYDEYSDDEDESADNKAPNIHRMIIFYKLINTTLNTLQTIFVPYFSLLLDYCAEDLTLLNGGNLELFAEESENAKNQSLSKKRKREEMSPTRLEVRIGDTQHKCILLIVSALTACFTFDQGNGLMQDKSKFDLIMQPLVDQLQNLSNEDDSADNLKKFGARTEAIAKCLGVLATVIQHQLWKPLQLQVLQQTQRTAPSIKCAAINVLISLYSTVGQEFVSMLPEMLPYVAELLEDDEEVVVRETQRLVQKVEETCGEDLSRYMQ